MQRYYKNDNVVCLKYSRGSLTLFLFNIFIHKAWKYSYIFNYLKFSTHLKGDPS